MIDGARDANSNAHGTIAGIRNSLMAEHLGADCATVEAMIAESPKKELGAGMPGGGGMGSMDY